MWLYILRDAVWHTWRKYITSIITLITVYSFIREIYYPNSNLIIMSDLLRFWAWWLWLTIGLVLLVLSILTIAIQQKRELVSNDNWIIAHKAKTGKFPAIPNSLLDLVDEYIKGQPISKNIKLKERPSHQQWGRLTLENRERFLQIMDWKGLDRHDFLQHMKDTRPPGGRFPPLKRKR
jgi:hypothetical protein